jgi:glycosyltransferase involved in cell wall biosynthesis
LSYEPERSVGGSQLMRDQLFAQLDPAIHERIEIILCVPQGPPVAGRRRVLWQQLDVDQPNVAFLRDRVTHEAFDRFVFVSHWQATRYARTFGVPPERTVILRNAIHPIAPHDKPTEGRLKVVYTSTPWRGLDVLLDSWELLRPRDAELHVFSSCKLYGPRFGQNDGRFEHLYRKARTLEGVHYRGILPNDELRQELATAHVLAYPSTFAETSCIAVIEAMAAGCHVVTSNLGALPETCAGFAHMYPYTADHDVHVARFAEELARILRDGARSPVDALQVRYFNHQYGWRLRVEEWRRMLSDLENAENWPGVGGSRAGRP